MLRKNYYMMSKSNYDVDLIVNQQKIIFNGMELNIVRKVKEINT